MVEVVGHERGDQDAAGADGRGESDGAEGGGVGESTGSNHGGGANDENFFEGLEGDAFIFFAACFFSRKSDDEAGDTDDARKLLS